jgi:hypothetical protein
LIERERDRETERLPVPHSAASSYAVGDRQQTAEEGEMVDLDLVVLRPPNKIPH